jgi:putative spermidine/putrescine transport system substrate-binding protein
MEDFEAQEHEFWARLSEDGMSRSQMLRRSAAAALGLTVLGAPASALASRARFTGSTLPTSGAAVSINELVSEAKKEGHLNVIALPPDWANYGEIISTFQKKYGLGMTQANPNGTSADENQAISSLKGNSRAPTRSTSHRPSRSRVKVRALRPYKVSSGRRADHPARCEGRWAGDRGAVSIGFNTKPYWDRTTVWGILKNPAYKGQVALNGSPLTSGSAVGGVFAAALANGGSLNNVGPGVDFFAKLKDSGNFITVQSTPQTVASGQTPISIDWDYLNSPT